MLILNFPSSITVVRGLSECFDYKPSLFSSCVRVVSSQRSGMGKSLYIRRRAEFLVDLNPTSKGCVTIPVHGPRVTPDSVMAFLKDHIANSTGTIFHIDVSPSVSIVTTKYMFG